jgi:branched-chain amino acid transport system ATP-binding protein
LLDELSLGLAPLVVERIYALLPELLAGGLTVLLVEQDVGQALRVADHIHCLLEGSTTLAGAPSSFSRPEIEAAYFGVDTVRPGDGDAPCGTGSAATPRPSSTITNDDA